MKLINRKTKRLVLVKCLNEELKVFYLQIVDCDKLVAKKFVANDLRPELLLANVKRLFNKLNVSDVNNLISNNVKALKANEIALQNQTFQKEEASEQLSEKIKSETSSSIEEIIDSISLQSLLIIINKLEAKTRKIIRKHIRGSSKYMAGMLKSIQIFENFLIKFKEM